MKASPFGCPPNFAEAGAVTEQASPDEEIPDPESAPALPSATLAAGAIATPVAAPASADFDSQVSASFFTPTTGETGVVVDLTVLSQDWIDGVWPNHGVMLQATSTDPTSVGSKEARTADWVACMEVIPECAP